MDLQTLTLPHFQMDNNSNKTKKLYFCNPATLARKGCKFLSKYDGTMWADTENYYSDFSDIQFLNSIYFISFFDINTNISYCKGWTR